MDAISPIAGTLLPIERAEELLQTLPGVLNVRIVSGQTGEVSEVHILTTTEVSRSRPCATWRAHCSRISACA